MIDQLSTPCLLVYESKLQSNIEKMQRQVNKLNVNIRPHIKTHKSPYIAKRYKIHFAVDNIDVVDLLNTLAKEQDIMHIRAIIND